MKLEPANYYLVDAIKTYTGPSLQAPTDCYSATLVSWVCVSEACEALDPCIAVIN